MDDTTATTTETQLEGPDPAHRPARLALYLGIALVAAGAVIMYLGYNGAATTAVPAAQTPYIISGGLLGVGLLALGGIAVAVHVILAVQADFRVELRGMRDSIEQLAEAMTRQAFASGGLPSTNGHTIVMVARGASSFHREECRLVQRADHLRSIPKDEADREGLAPCRICKP
ncbi:MAG TPA: hypothetical protein VGB52_12230 [Actinomycetota bacterium]